MTIQLLPTHRSLHTHGHSHSMPAQSNGTLASLPAAIANATSPRAKLFQALYEKKVITMQGDLTPEYASKQTPLISQPILDFLRKEFNQLRSFVIEGKTVETTMTQILKEVEKSESEILKKSVFTSDFVAYLLFSEEFGYIEALFKSWGLQEIYKECIQGHCWVKKPPHITFRSEMTSQKQAPTEEDLGNLLMKVIEKLNLEDLPSQQLAKAFHAGHDINGCFRIIKLPETPFRWMWEAKQLPRYCFFNVDGFTLPLTLLRDNAASFSNLIENENQAFIHFLLGQLITNNVEELDNKGWHWLQWYSLQGHNDDKELEIALFKKAFSSGDLSERPLKSLQEWANGRNLNPMEQWTLLFNTSKKLNTAFEFSFLLNTSNSLYNAVTGLLKENPLGLDMLNLCVAAAVARGSTVAQQSYRSPQTPLYQIEFPDATILRLEGDVEESLKHLSKMDPKIAEKFIPYLESVFIELMTERKQVCLPFPLLTTPFNESPFVKYLSLLFMSDSQKGLQRTFLQRYPDVMLTTKNQLLRELLHTEAEKMLGQGVPCFNNAIDPAEFLEKWVLFLLKIRSSQRQGEEILCSFVKNFQGQFNSKPLFERIPSILKTSTSLAKNLFHLASSEEKKMLSLKCLAILSEKQTLSHEDKEFFIILEKHLAERMAEEKHSFGKEEQNAFPFIARELARQGEYGKAWKYDHSSLPKKALQKIAEAHLEEIYPLESQEIFSEQKLSEAWHFLNHVLKNKQIEDRDLLPYLLKLCCETKSKKKEFISLLEQTLRILIVDSKLLGRHWERLEKMILVILENHSDLPKKMESDLTTIISFLCKNPSSIAFLEKLMVRIVTQNIPLTFDESMAASWFEALNNKSFGSDRKKMLLYAKAKGATSYESQRPAIRTLCLVSLESSLKEPDYIETVLFFNEEKWIGVQDTLSSLLTSLKEKVKNPKNKEAVAIFDHCLELFSNDLNSIKECLEEWKECFLNTLEKIPHLASQLSSESWSAVSDISRELFLLLTDIKDKQRLMFQVMQQSISFPLSDKMAESWIRALQSPDLGTERKKKLLYFKKEECLSYSALHPLLGELCSSLIEAVKQPIELFETLFSLNVTEQFKQGKKALVLKMIRRLEDKDKKKKELVESAFQWESKWKPELYDELIKICLYHNKNHPQKTLQALQSPLFSDRDEPRFQLICRSAIANLMLMLSNVPDITKVKEELSLLHQAFLEFERCFLQDYDIWLPLLTVYKKNEQFKELLEIWKRAEALEIFKDREDDIRDALTLIIPCLRDRDHALLLDLLLRYSKALESSTDSLPIFLFLLEDAHKWGEEDSQIYCLLITLYESFKRKFLTQHPIRLQLEKNENYSTLFKENRLLLPIDHSLSSSEENSNSTIGIIEQNYQEYYLFISKIDLEIIKSFFYGTGYSNSLKNLSDFLSIPHLPEIWNSIGDLMNLLVSQITTIRKPENYPYQSQYLALLVKILAHLERANRIKGLDYPLMVSGLISFCEMTQLTPLQIQGFRFLTVLLRKGCQFEGLYERKDAWKLFAEVFTFFLKQPFGLVNASVDDLLQTTNLHLKNLSKNHEGMLTELHFFILTQCKNEVDFALTTDTSILTEDKLQNMLLTLETCIPELHTQVQNPHFIGIMAYLPQLIVNLSQFKISENDYLKILDSYWKKIAFNYISGKRGSKFHGHFLSIKEMANHKLIFMTHLSVHLTNFPSFPLRTLMRTFLKGTFTIFTSEEVNTNPDLYNTLKERSENLKD